MKNLKQKLPQKMVKTIYHFHKKPLFSSETTTTVCSDPTNYCGTVYTTTHLLQR